MFLNEIRNLRRDLFLAAAVTAFPETENPADGFSGAGRYLYVQ